jgi:outer membrane receptor protein involved in Fe transport
MKPGIIMHLTALTLIAGVVCFGGDVTSQATGTISGKIVDVSTDEALVGSNVLVLGTPYGAASDVYGRFVIQSIPPGRYTIRASLVGYQTVEVKDVSLRAGQNLRLDFKMASTAIQMEPVVVTAEALVNPSATSSTRTIYSESIRDIPNVKDVKDIAAIQPGFVQQGSNLFLRGGRANEIQYVVDGIATNDILGGSGSVLATSAANEQLQQLYTGMEGGAIGGGTSGLVVSSNAVQSVSVSSSGFDAEYGNAQSGVISIITKSGGERYTASGQVRTDRLGNSASNEAYYSFSGGGPEPITSHILPSLGIDLPGRMSLFLSSDFSQSDGPFRYEKNELNNPLRHRVRLGGFLGGLLGFSFRNYQHNAFTFNSKFRYDFSTSDQITYGYRSSLGVDHHYRHPWKFRADSSLINVNTSEQSVVQWTHFWGEESSHRLNIGKLSNVRSATVAGLPPSLYSPAISQTDPNGDGFNDLGSDQTWFEGTTSVWTVKLDYNGRPHPLHFLKTGLESNFEEIQSTEIQYPLAPNRDTANTRGEYPKYGLYRWVMNNYPSRGSFYVQDNISFYGINVNVGIRYDYLYPGRQIFDEGFVRQWEAATGLRGPYYDENGNGRQDGDEELKWAYVDDHDLLHINKQSGGSTLLYYLTHGGFSPRVAIGYPITERTVFYFNYGHFLQFPDRDQYFRDPFTLVPDNWIGNPDLKPQRTIQYEAGFDHQFLEDMAVSVRGFYKDIKDYATLAPTGRGNVPVYVYVNLDYASARGFDATLTKAFTRNFSGTLSYSYQIAKGRSSSPFAAVYQPEFQLPRETRLNWDQRSTINLFISYRVGPREEYELLGMPFVNNWGFSLTWNYGSGFPYTPYNPGRTLATVYLKNSATGPPSSNVNLSLYKGFLLFEKMNLSFTLEVTNLLDSRNVAVLDVGYGFNTLEGRPYEFGDYDPATRVLYQYHTMAGKVPPNVYSDPRQVLLGMRINWE